MFEIRHIYMMGVAVAAVILFSLAFEVWFKRIHRELVAISTELSLLRRQLGEHQRERLAFASKLAATQRSDLRGL